MLRLTARITNRRSFSVSRINSNFGDDLESLLQSSIKSNSSLKKKESRSLNEETEDSLKKLFASFSEKSQHKLGSSFRPVLRNRVPLGSSQTRLNLNENKKAAPFNPKRNIDFSKIPEEISSIVSHIAKNLQKDVLVHNSKNPNLSNLMTKSEAINHINWENQGLKIIDKSLPAGDVKRTLNTRSIYIPLDSDELLSVIEIVDKSEMNLQLFKDEMKMEIIKSFGSSELLDLISEREKASEKKEQIEKSANTFKLARINWECSPSDTERKLKAAIKTLQKGDRYELVFGPESYLFSTVFNNTHHTQVTNITRSKLGTNPVFLNEKAFNEEIAELFELRKYNKGKSIKQREDLINFALSYLDENKTKYKTYGNVETFFVISIHSIEMPEKELPEASKTEQIKVKKEKKMRKAAPKPKIIKPVEDLYSMKIEN